ncbi:MAG: alpha-hydroxy-acid oxidizing protein [Deltaproteobacteria bacterium]|nr:alpha-hydroxy-acid oxidizing protein [Deltaproteobacteria bacterium]
MPKKYMIHTATVPHRFKAITRFGIIAWEEGCLKCPVCVKKECVYKVYERRGLDAGQMIDSLDNECMNCLRCVQGCPKELIHKSINPEYQALGDVHYTPDILARLWYQAETGKIPVSGAGYPGPFSGTGFDGMWTDMSEIVRPTRDGIHGREYISTAVDLGRTPRNLAFDEKGNLLTEFPPLMDIPLPIILRVPSFGSFGEEVIKGWAMAARRLGTFLALPLERTGGKTAEYFPHLMPIISDQGKMPSIRVDTVRFMEAPLEGKVTDRAKKAFPSAVLSIHLPMVKGVEERALRVAASGASVIHLEASCDGKALDDSSRPMKDVIRSVHRTLVEGCVRDEVTLLVSGGIAMAEHVAKAVICGADAVIVDFPILVALECRMCRRCTRGLLCPVEIEKAPSSWVAARVFNLIGAWHNQLLELMGAMGIRDARRLRGETGRAMFFEELDEATFGSMGEVKEGYELL